jgi:hypothetical protein
MEGQQSESQQLSVPCWYPRVGEFRLAFIDDFIKHSDYGNILPSIHVHNENFGIWKIFQNENGWLFIIPSLCEWIIPDYETNDKNKYFWAVRESDGTIHKGRTFPEFIEITKIPTQFIYDKSGSGYLRLILNIKLINESHYKFPTYTLKELGF